MDIPKSAWQVQHSLNTVTVRLSWGPDRPVHLRAQGNSDTTTRLLWQYEEEFGPACGDLAPHDAAAHLLLVCLQDRPRTLELLNLALGGYGLWEDQPLPFE